MLFVLLALGLVAYLVVGVFNARSVYAIQMQQQDSGKSLNDLRREHTRAINRVNDIRHGLGCNMNYPTLARKGCDCYSKVSWREASDALGIVRQAIANYPAISYMSIFLWWADMIGRFIRNGYKPDEKQKLEQWLSTSYVKDDPRYDTSHAEKWNMISAQYEQDQRCSNIFERYKEPTIETAPQKR